MVQKNGQEYKLIIMKNNFFLTSLMLIFTFSCGQKNNTKKENNMNINKEAPYNIVDEGDGKKFNFDKLSIDITTFGTTSLKNFNYKFPDYDLFTKKIQTVFGININDYNNTIIALRISDFPEIALKQNKYILIQDSDSENKYSINSEVLYHFNKYIFYDDLTSLNILKLKDPYLLKDLVTYYGYNTDKNLMSFVFKDFDFENNVSFHELLFGRKNQNKQYVLRKGIVNDIEQIIYGGKTKDILSETKEGKGYDSISNILETMYNNPNEYNNYLENIAFLCDKALNVGYLGDVQSFIHKNKKILESFKKNNYFGNERLKIFSENLNVIDKTEEKASNFYINDPDGYTNLRKDKSTSSEILQKVKTGEQIEVLNDTGDWFLIKTKEGKEGYIHKNRLESK